MDLVKLLGEEFEARVLAENPSSFCLYVVNHVQTEYFKRGESLPASFVCEMLKQAIAQLRVLLNVIHVNRSVSEADSTYQGRVTVIGDLHGQYRDLEYLLSEDGPIGFPSLTNQIVINGDMVDRGDMSVEIVVLLSLITVLSPGSVHMLKGNHESCPSLSEVYGFHEEIQLKYPHDPVVDTLFAQLLDVLPVAAVVDKEVFVVHGGVGHFTHTMTPTQFNRGNRFSDPVPGTPIFELLWSDPQPDMKKPLSPRFAISSSRTIYIPASPPVIYPPKRGESFTSAQTSTFLAKNNYKLLLRAGQCCDSGIRMDHNDLCVTVFSAPNYSGTHQNAGAVVMFTHPTTTEPHIVQFESKHYVESSAARVFGKRYAEVSTHRVRLDSYDENLDFDLQRAMELSLTLK